MKLNSIVVVSLHSPKEKIWGQLLDLKSAGLTIRGLDLGNFDSWLADLSSEDAIGLSTVFVPLHRVERVALDEPVGKVPSLTEIFQQKTGMTLSDYLGGPSSEERT